MAAQSPELQSKIAQWRARAIEGTLTAEEMREAVAALRQGRISAAHASEASRRSKARVEVPTADDLLNEIGGL